MGEYFNLKRGNNIVRVSLDTLPLSPGIYNCNIWVGKGNTPLDWIQNCFILKVEAKKLNKGFIENRGYPIIINSAWSLMEHV
jgi:hypothetical protein